MALCSAAIAGDIYVSPTGSDMNPGSKDRPVATLERARDLVAKLTPSMTRDIVVSLREGTYRLKHTFALGTLDSGMNGHKVIWQAFPGEKVILTGAIKVSGWQLHEPGKNIYRAHVPAGTVSRQMFVNGVRAYRVRSASRPAGFPESVSPNNLPGDEALTSDAAGLPKSGSPNNPIVASETHYLSWRKPGESNPVELVWEYGWKQVRCPIVTIAPAAEGTGSAITMATPCYSQSGNPPPHFNRPPYNAGSSVNPVSWIENAFELLGTPGQFYLDSAAGDLYYVPREGENMNTADVELPVVQTLMSLSGTPGSLIPVNDDDASISYEGTWRASTNRPNGDFYDDVHYTENNGDSASIQFTGTGINILSETSSAGGDIDVYVDGIFDRTVSAAVSGDPHPMQVLYFKNDMAPGRHTVKLVKKNGKLMVLDGYVPINAVIAPVHDIEVKGIQFSYSTWLAPNDSSGYWENQAGLLWTGTPEVFRRATAALQVMRGQRIQITDGQFKHLGGSAIDLGEGTQDSSVTANRIHDVSSTGISVGEFDDFWLTDPKLMTSGNTINNNAVSYTGQEYRDTVGILAGYVRNTAINHNEVGHLPYTGISVNLGWTYFAPCPVIAQATKGKNARWALPCTAGTNFAQGNQINGNFVHDVMTVLHDGGGIYVNGGQGSSAVHSAISGNVIVRSAGNGIYVDIGSSWWDVTDNVVSKTRGNWVDMWVEVCHNIKVDTNYTDTSKCANQGYIAGADLEHYTSQSYPEVRNGTTNVTTDGSKPTTTISNTTLVTGNNWPEAARRIAKAAGLQPAYESLAKPAESKDGDTDCSNALDALLGEVQ